MSSSITIRMDEDVKEQAKALFHKLGFSVSRVVDAFFRQAIQEQAIPIKVKTAKEIEDEEYFNEYNMKIIRESIAQLDAGEVTVMTLDELRAMENE